MGIYINIYPLPFCPFVNPIKPILKMENKIIKNYSRYSISKTGIIKNIRQDKIRKIFKTKKGYIKIPLYNDTENKLKTPLVHRLVWETHVGEIQNVINHIDGDKTNNSLENLEDVSIRTNNLHQIKNSTKKYKSKFTGISKRKNGYYRARVMVNGKTYETSRKTEQGALDWYIAKCKELNLSIQYQRK